MLVKGGLFGSVALVRVAGGVTSVGKTGILGRLGALLFRDVPYVRLPGPPQGWFFAWFVGLHARIFGLV